VPEHRGRGHAVLVEHGHRVGHMLLNGEQAHIGRPRAGEIGLGSRAFVI
jgi:hypothetical protein